MTMYPNHQPINKMSISKTHQLKDILPWVLIVLSSTLLGIWAVKETIALRNSLLLLEAVISIIYCTLFFKENTQKISWKNATPLILLGCMFCWVMFHYFFLSRFPEIQLKELTSTWLRSGLALIVGFGTGLAMIRRPGATYIIWLGIFTSFLYLIYQYIPKAIALNSLYAIDYANYIYLGKINAVLAGTILIAGLLGAFLDSARLASWKLLLMAGLFCITGMALALYAYVFILDTRNGVGLAGIVLGAALAIAIKRYIFGPLKQNERAKRRVIFIPLLICLIGVFAWFGVQHTKHNPGWSTMIEDTKVAMQVTKYPNWQNPGALGYPQNANGQPVKINTYERVAWAVAGWQILMPENPLGVGLLDGSFMKSMQAKYPNSAQNLFSTHSGWTELGLAFGYPALILMLGSLIALLLLALKSSGPHQAIAGLMALTLFSTYAVGELSSNHAIEMFFFMAALMTALLIDKNHPGVKSAKTLV